MDKKRFAPVLIHFLIWAVLFSIPIFIRLENPDLTKFSGRVFIMLVFAVLTFYPNQVWAIDKLLYKHRYVLFALFNFALLIVLHQVYCALLHCTLIMGDLPSHQHRFAGGMHFLFYFNEVFFFLLSVGAAVGIRSAQKLYRVEIQQKKLENETLTSELSFLKYQIQPHFFFNSLNNIYSLISTSPMQAQKSVHSLSKMMRYILYDSSNPTIPLAKEVQFLSNYKALMQLRLRESAKVAFDYPEETLGVNIPPLLFIPLLENAFKHGIGPNGEADIRCTLAADDCHVSFRVTNIVYPVDNEDRSHSGIGLANLKKRLEILYSDSFVFIAGLDAHDGSNGDSDIYEAFISVPLNYSIE